MRVAATYFLTQIILVNLLDSSDYFTMDNVIFCDLKSLA